MKVRGLSGTKGGKGEEEALGGADVVWVTFTAGIGVGLATRGVLC